jgi:flagellar basal-body rod protein FlgB
MQPVQLFDLAAQQAKWLSVRQSAIAGNIANANTPGYGAVDVPPFERVLENVQVALAATQPGHFPGNGAQASPTVREQKEKAPSMPSGNNVVLEQELMKAGEVRRSFELNTAIVKAFHRMMLMTTRP